MKTLSFLILCHSQFNWESPLATKPQICKPETNSNAYPSWSLDTRVKTYYEISRYFNLSA